MAAWADSTERFVEIPGIVEIRWKSDDPEYYVAFIDLFDEQKNGLPDFYGKKDKTTTEQAFFVCNVCECDLKSVVTLRAHCKGTQHIRKTLQKKKEWGVKLKEAGVEAKTRTGEFKAKREKVEEQECSPGENEDKRGEYEEIVEPSKRERSHGRESKRSLGYERERRGGRGREERCGTEDISRRVKNEYRERIQKEEPRYNRDQLYRERTSSRRETVREFSREVEEVTRSGNFENWSTATVKADIDTSMASTSSQAVTITSQQKSVSEEVDRLHRKVATKVMTILDKFYPGSEEFDPDLHKIRSSEDYRRLAKQFSHQLRKQIKESYEAYHTTLEGIVLTGDHEQFIRTEVESYLEKKN